MSTRANIKVISSREKPLWFYRHSDGYPEGAMPLIARFMDWLNRGMIRDNVGQSAGWLIILGHLEYRPNPEPKEKFDLPQFSPVDERADYCGLGWKCGSIEPTTWELHGDVEYLYTIDLSKKTVACQAVISAEKNEFKYEPLKPLEEYLADWRESQPSN